MRTYILEITFTDGTKFEDTFTPDRIKKAFNFGRGNEQDLLNYIDNNKSTIEIKAKYND